MKSNRKRSAKHVGSRSPASGSAKEQSIAGHASGPQAEQTPPRTPRQPAQTSGRRSARHEQEPEERKGFSPEEDPSQQGLPHTKPDVIRRHSGQQGLRERNER
jgi:hypothetical protein